MLINEDQYFLYDANNLEDPITPLLKDRFSDLNCNYTGGGLIKYYIQEKGLELFGITGFKGKEGASKIFFSQKNENVDPKWWHMSCWCESPTSGSHCSQEKAYGSVKAMAAYQARSELNILINWQCSKLKDPDDSRGIAGCIADHCSPVKEGRYK